MMNEQNLIEKVKKLLALAGNTAAFYQGVEEGREHIRQTKSLEG